MVATGKIDSDPFSPFSELPFLEVSFARSAPSSPEFTIGKSALTPISLYRMSSPTGGVAADRQRAQIEGMTKDNRSRGGFHPEKACRKMNQVKEIAALCFKHCDEAVGIIAFLEAGNTPDVETNYCGGAHVGKLIRKAIEERLLMLIMRMHDGRGTDRRDTIEGLFLARGSNGEVRAFKARWRRDEA